MSAARRRRRPRRGGLPIPALALALVAVTFFALPFAGLLWRAPWRDAWSILRAPDSRDALLLSLRTSTSATALSIVFGVPLA